jgi:long-chain acyl-CoA synthetase
MTGPEVGRLVMLDDLVAAFPARGEHPAIITLAADGKVSTVSYAGLHEDLSRFTRGLVHAFGDGAQVLLWAPNSAAWITAYFGIVAAGGIVIPLDDQAGTEGLGVVLAQDKPAAVVTVTPHLKALHETGISERTIFLLDTAEEARNWRRLMRDGNAAGHSARNDKCVAVLLYTSGTTGTPKGVPLTHENLMSNVRGLLDAGIVRGSDRVLLPLPLHHAYPATVAMLTVLARGAAIVLPAGVTGPELTTAANRAGATILVGVPRLYEALLESVSAAVHARAPVVRMGFRLMLRFCGMLRRATGINIGRLAFRSMHRRIGRSLRTLVSGGARLDPALAKRLEALGWLVLSGYGLTETSPVVTFNLPRPRRLDTQGRALTGVELRIDDPAGEGRGEIQVRGPNVFSGYWNDAGATERAFTEDHWFRTGDSGFLDRDGFLHVLGRQSDVIVLSDGKKIAPEPLERRYEQSPYIREVALLAPRGDLLALVVPDEDAVRARGTMSALNLLRDELDTVSSALPSWQRIRGYKVLRQSLPRTRLGKLRRHLLPALYARSSETSPQAGAIVIGEDDRRLLQSTRAEPVWRWLNERYAGVTLDSSPQLDLGIDSLGWVSLTSEIEDQFGVALGGEQLSRILTVRDLLQVVDSSARTTPGEARGAAGADEAARYLARPGVTLRLLATLIMVCVRLLMAGPYRLRVVGSENMPADGPFLLAPNHCSYLDPAAVAAALSLSLRRRTCWAGWARKMHKGPVWRTASRSLRVFPVDADQDLGGAIRLGAQVLAAGDALVWFPEGRRSRDGELQQFRPGVGVLLQRAPVPVVPVRIEGTFAAWPPHRRWPRFRPLSVTFGRALSPEWLREHGKGEQDSARISDALTRTVAALEPVPSADSTDGRE